jgi:hypothetical protein
VRVRTGDHAQRRRALQAVGLDVPAGVAQDGMAAGNSAKYRDARGVFVLTVIFFFISCVGD